MLYRTRIYNFFSELRHFRSKKGQKLEPNCFKLRNSPFLISVINQPNTQILVLQQVYFMPLHVSNTMRSLSGGQNCITQHLVSSHSLSGRPVHRTATYTWSFCCASAGKPDTSPAEPHPYSNTRQTKNETANMVVQQHIRILLKMSILMPETCWVSKK